MNKENNIELGLIAVREQALWVLCFVFAGIQSGHP